MEKIFPWLIAILCFFGGVLAGLQGTEKEVVKEKPVLDKELFIKSVVSAFSLGYKQGMLTAFQEVYNEHHHDIHYRQFKLDSIKYKKEWEESFK